MKVSTKTIVYLALLSLSHSIVFSQGWKPAGDKIMSPWAAKIDPANVLAEYPRPQMVRKDWKNLNGLWQYAILPKSEQTIPAAWQGDILVPYCVESALSGVGKTVGKDSILWYKKKNICKANFCTIILKNIQN